jgi:hypothetical protein
MSNKALGSWSNCIGVGHLGKHIIKMGWSLGSEPGNGGRGGRDRELAAEELSLWRRLGRVDFNLKRRGGIVLQKALGRAVGGKISTAPFRVVLNSPLRYSSKKKFLLSGSGCGNSRATLERW